MPLSALPAPELARRVRHARQNRHLSAADLDALLEEDGCDQGEGTRLEAGTSPLMRKTLDSLVRHLRRPEEWFTG